VRWIDERWGNSIRHSIALERVHYEGSTAWQQVLIANNRDLGDFLVLDGQLQSAQCDEFIYHECLVHPILLSHHQPRSVLILGGGEGATLREVLRHPCVERVLMLELDPLVVELSRRYLPTFSAGAFDDPRVELVIAEARGWLEQHSETFDVILSDLTEPEEDALSSRLFSRQFFQLARTRLKAGGMLATQASCGAFGHLDRHCLIARTCRSVLQGVHSLAVGIPSFNTLWSFVVASSGMFRTQLLPWEIEAAIKERGLKGLRFYDPETHQRIFALPLCHREQLQQPGPLLEDEALPLESIGSQTK
jgi:spermidine synthase